MTVMPSQRLRRIRTIAILSATQIIGWGTTFEMPGALGRTIARGLGVSNEMAFAGITVMMLVSGLVGPRVGRMIQARGAVFSLGLGSSLMGLGLIAIALSHELVLYGAGWVCLGLGGALGLSAPAYTAVVEREGDAAKRSIAVMMVFSGLSSAIFWPILSLLDGQYGWRATLVFCGLLHIVVCMPLHVWGLPAPEPHAPQDTLPDDRDAAATQSEKRLAFGLIAAISTLFSVATFGISPVLITLLAQSGASPAMALYLASFRSVLGIIARFGDLMLGRRSTPLLAMTAASVLVIAAFASLGLFAPAMPALIVFITLYGFGSGVGAVARTVLPLGYFTKHEFGLIFSRIALPQNFASAFAPVLMTALLDRGGVAAVLWAAAMLVLMLLACLWRLARVKATI